MVLGSGGHGLSLLNKICVGAKLLRSWFLWSFNVIWKLCKLRKFITIPIYFSTIAKTIWCWPKLWFLGVSIVMRHDLKRFIVICLNLVIYCKSWWYILQTYLCMDLIRIIKKDGFLRLIVFRIVKIMSTDKKIAKHGLSNWQCSLGGHPTSSV